MQADYNKNIKLNILIRGFVFTWVNIPTLALYYLDRGLTVSDLILFKSVLSGVALILEIPSGYLADVVGRKKTIVMGCLFWLASIACYCLFSGYYYFLLAEVLLGVAVSLLSGVDSALVFDSLKLLGREDQYKRIEGRMSSVSGYAEAAGGLVGAYLASFNLAYPFYLQFVLIFIALLLSLFLIEPERIKAPKKEAWANIFGAVKFALHGHKQIRSLILFYGISGCSTLLLVWLAQVYMKEVQLPTAYFGIAWAVFHLMMGLSSQWAHFFDEHFGSLGGFRILACLTGISFLMLGIWQSVYGLIFIALLYCVRGLRTPIFRHYINHQVESDVRATILSVQGFSVRFFAIIAGPIISWVLAEYTLSAAMFVVGVSVSVLLGFSLKLIEKS